MEGKNNFGIFLAKFFGMTAGIWFIENACCVASENL